MRTNIELDDLEVRSAELRRASYKDRLASIRGRTSGLRLDKSATSILREDRRRA